MGVTDRSSLAVAFVIALAVHGILAGVPMPAFVTPQDPPLSSPGVLDVSIRPIPPPRASLPASSPASSEDSESRAQEEAGRPERAVPKMEQAPRPGPVVQKPKETQRETAGPRSEGRSSHVPAVAHREDVPLGPSGGSPRAGEHTAVETTPGDGISEQSERVAPAEAAAAPSPSDAARTGPREEPVLPAAPRYRENPPPDYPPAARRRGYEGLVVLSVTVAADGRVREVALASSSGHDVLDNAALQAVRRWRFEPAKRGGVSVEMAVDVPVRFELRREQAW